VQILFKLNPCAELKINYCAHFYLFLCAFDVTHVIIDLIHLLIKTKRQTINLTSSTCCLVHLDKENKKLDWNIIKTSQEINNMAGRRRSYEIESDMSHDLPMSIQHWGIEQEWKTVIDGSIEDKRTFNRYFTCLKIGFFIVTLFEFVVYIFVIKPSFPFHILLMVLILCQGLCVAIALFWIRVNFLRRFRKRWVGNHKISKTCLQTDAKKSTRDQIFVRSLIAIQKWFITGR
jgi:hypothetical protein